MVSIVNEMPANITTGPSQRRRRNNPVGEFEIETLRSAFGDDMVTTSLTGNRWPDTHNITHRSGHENRLRSARQATVEVVRPPDVNGRSEPVRLFRLRFISGLFRSG